MDEKYILDWIMDWSYWHRKDLWDLYYVKKTPEERKQVARRMVIERVIIEPEFEDFLPCSLLDKIKEVDNVDLRRINWEYGLKMGWYEYQTG